MISVNVLLLFFPLLPLAAAASSYSALCFPFPFHFYVFTQNDYGFSGECVYALSVLKSSA